MTLVDPTGEDYSASTTTIHFDAPIPLLRGPVAEGLPRGRSFVLAFKSRKSWAAGYASSVALVTKQCEDGVRVSCSISASNTCKPSWWSNLFGPRPSGEELAKRDACEVREMRECMEKSKGKCAEFARNKCTEAYWDAMIMLDDKDLAKWMTCLVPFSNNKIMTELWMRRLCKRSYKARDVAPTLSDFEAMLEANS